MLRRKEAEGTLQVSEETSEADMKSILEGGKFLFLRDVCCKMNRGEEEVEVCSSGQEADDEGPETNSQNSKHSRLCDLIAELEVLTLGEHLGIVRMPEQRNRVKGRRVWEWSEYDTKAEHWLFEQENRVKAANGNIEKGRSEGDKVWEWTYYDEKAEQEEAKGILGDLDLDL